MIQVFKVLNDNTSLYPTDFLTLNERAGRNNFLKLYKKRNTLEVTRHFFTSRGVGHWNVLPDEVILSIDVNDFKIRLDKFMRNVRGRT